MTALLPAAAAMGVMHRIDHLAATVAGGDEVRTLPQLRADVLCDLLLTSDARACVSATVDVGDASGSGAGSGVSDGPGALEHTREEPTADTVPSWVRGIVPQVVLTVPVLSLLGHGGEPAALDGFGPIDMDTARALCANAPTFTRVLTHPETGAVLSVGRDRYTVPADLRRVVELRDATCRFPGCRRRAARCDLDHSTAWESGGGTDLTNLAALCRKHHRLKHETGWQITHRTDGTLDWRSPTGRHHRTRPASSLWPPPAPGTGPPPGTDPPGGVPRENRTAGRQPAGYPDVPPY